MGQVIPKKFVKNYGNDFLDSVLLKVPSGSEWRVELFRSNDDVCLGNGWEEFVKHNSLAHGHLLVFEYEKNSCFDVLLFDMSATEMDYPIMVNASQKPIVDGKSSKDKVARETDDVVFVKSLDDCGSPFSHRRKKTNVTFEFERSLDVQTSAFVNGSKSNEIKDRDKSSKKRRIYKVTERTWSLTKEERAKAQQRANASFKSKNPFFLLVMQPTYVYHSMLSVPSKFMERYFQKAVGKVALQVLRGGTWIVNFNIYHNKKHATFTHNWNAFSRDNNLKVGDACIFELIGANEVVLNLKVRISRATGDIDFSIRPAHESGTNSMGSKRCLQSKDNNHPSKASLTTSTKYTDTPSCLKSHGGVAAANISTPGNPSFEVVIRSWNFNNGFVNIPCIFVKNYLKESKNTAPVNLQVAKRLWPIKLRTYSHCRNGCLGAGWREFARDNCIQARDVCTFELIQTDPLLLHVSIRKHAG